MKAFYHDMTRTTVLDTLAVSRAVPGHGVGTIHPSCLLQLDRIPDNFGFRVVRFDSHTNHALDRLLSVAIGVRCGLATSEIKRNCQRSVDPFAK